MSSVTESPASMLAAGTSLRASGDRLGTVAVKDCVAERPPGSVAVTVMVGGSAGQGR